MTETLPPRPASARPWRSGAAVCLLLAATWAAVVRGAPSPVTLSLVGTTDLHGFIAPRDGAGGLAVFGGYMRTLREARRADGGAVVLLDAGDTYLGGIESNMSEGAVVVDAYNALGYAAGAFGNHDLEFGAPDPWEAPVPPAAGRDPRGAIKALARHARYPLLAANLLDATTQAPVDWPNVQPSAIVEAAGVRVGLVGVMTYDALSMTLAANVRGLATGPLAAAVEREARALRGRGAQVVVVVAHAGGSCWSFTAPDDLSACDDSAEIFDVVRAVPRGLIDAVVGGHTHDGVAHRVNGVPIVQAYSWGRAFGRVDLQVDPATGVAQEARIFAPQDICQWHDAATGRCAATPSSSTVPARYEGRPVMPDDAVSAAMAPALALVARHRAQPLGVDLPRAIARGGGDAESPLGNLFAEALRAAVPGADAALSYGAGPGGLRAELATGPLTVGALYDLFPFDNRVEALAVSGAELRQLLVDHVRRPRFRARALGVAGLRIVHACGSGGDVVDVTRASGAPLADDARVVVAMTDFLAARARALHLGAPASAAPGDLQIRDALVSWVRAQAPRLSGTSLSDEGAPRWARVATAAGPCPTAP